MNEINVKFLKTIPRAKLPTYASEGAAGMDISSVNHYRIEPGNREFISTGLRCAIPYGYQLEVRPRSGLAFRNGISIVNSPGTIDSDYRGEIMVVLINHGDEDFIIIEGDRIAQLVLMPAPQATIVEVEEGVQLDNTKRGEGGFGSTGK